MAGVEIGSKSEAASVDLVLKFVGEKEGGCLNGGPVVENPPCNEGDSGSIPGQGTKIPHALEQLNPHAATKTQLGQINKIKKTRQQGGGMLVGRRGRSRGRGMLKGKGT